MSWSERATTPAGSWNANWIEATNKAWLRSNVYIWMVWCRSVCATSLFIIIELNESVSFGYISSWRSVCSRLLRLNPTEYMRHHLTCFYIYCPTPNTRTHKHISSGSTTHATLSVCIIYSAKFCKHIVMCRHTDTLYDCVYKITWVVRTTCSCSMELFGFIYIYTGICDMP